MQKAQQHNVVKYILQSIKSTIMKNKGSLIKG